ncbi:hypothetical protein VPNG_03594 [Cytospora leucostoma]|uniref:Protein kinase domain-containing protein n=1 Tax=Cytospora leucostoma TaxID=1230097 RepID=A0A423XCZ1_9PEZI|nr:hypothetical protein VPNG_03594 [Cytospora leucostoma]
MADDSVVATVERVQYRPFAYLTPDNRAARISLALLGDRHGNGQSLVEFNPLPSGAPGDAPKSKYRLCLSPEYFGSSYESSWTLGKGSVKHPVNLQLCVTRSRLLKGPFLGIISIHPRSGAFMIQNVSQHHSIEYLEAGVELQYQEKHVLFLTRNHLRFGKLHYILEFNRESEASFSIARASYLREPIYNDVKLPYPPLDAFPKPTHVRIGDVVIHQSISSGAFGVVRVGVHTRSGEVVACKTIHCDRRNIATVRSEIIIASETARFVGVVPLIKAWCEHGNALPCRNTKIEDVHLLMPYARYDFGSAPWSEISLSLRLTLFWQVLTGLSNLHSAGIMHRDISPRNSLIFSLDQSAPKAAICDFGKSKKGARGMEILGLTMLHTFHSWRRADPIDESGHEAVLKQLTSLREQGHIPEELGVLLRSMLSWDPAERPTAKQALDHGVWQGITATAPNLKRRSSGISSEGGTAAGSGGKRMRRSDGQSPESPPGSIRGEE